MATETLKSRTARMALENGTDSQGDVVLVNLSMPNMSKSASDWNADKLLNIVDALAPCLSKTVNTVESVATYTITAS